jgi:ABC-2 type transport system permease protein
MISMSLYFSMLKANAKSILSYGIGSLFYLWLVIWIYPSIADSPGMEELMKSLPENMMKALGLSTGIQDIDQFIAYEYYGILFIIIMSIYSIMTATQLIARLVDRGSMAYLLSTPASRLKIASTQAVVLLSGLLIVVLINIVAGFSGTSWLIEDVSLNSTAFLQLNLVGFLMFFVISGYSFLFSCLFNDEKKALSASAVLTVIFYVLNLAGKMSEEFEWLLNLSFFSAFQPQNIVSGDYDSSPVVLGLTGAGIILYLAAVFVFRKRDLPL